MLTSSRRRTRRDGKGRRARRVWLVGLTAIAVLSASAAACASRAVLTSAPPPVSRDPYLESTPDRAERAYVAGEDIFEVGYQEEFAAGELAGVTAYTSADVLFMIALGGLMLEERVTLADLRRLDRELGDAVFIVVVAFGPVSWRPLVLATPVVRGRRLPTRDGRLYIFPFLRALAVETIHPEGFATIFRIAADDLTAPAELLITIADQDAGEIHHLRVAIR